MVRTRAFRTCASCHSRKIRCDLSDNTSNNRACSKCKELQQDCIPRTRKPYSSIIRRKRPPPPTDSGHTASPPRGNNPSRTHHPSNSTGTTPTTTSPTTITAQAKIIASTISHPTPRLTTIYTGPQTHGYASLLTLIGRDRTGSDDVPLQTGHTHHHFTTIPASAIPPLDDEDLAYLQSKGCFDLPTNGRELVRAYFKFVHPTFPVLDGEGFLRDYDCEEGERGVSLLLLWSLFSVSVGFVSSSSSSSYSPSLSSSPPSSSSSSSPKSTKEAQDTANPSILIQTKQTYFHRAKLLFDITTQPDKLVLIQAALLLSFWFVDAEDVKQSWYWSGIAFSLAQALGLHDVTTADANNGDGKTVEDDGRRKRVWWRDVWRCCLVRDVWLSYGMGRPLRLWGMGMGVCCGSTGSDMIDPIEKDSELEGRLGGMVLDGERVYTLDEICEIGEMWRSLVSVSSVLRKALCTKQASTQNLQMVMLQASSHEGRRPGSTLLIRVARLHTRLFQYTAAMALFQFNHEYEKLRDMADKTTALIESFLTEKLTSYAAPTVVPLLVPAVLMHMTRLKATPGVARCACYDDEKLAILLRFLTAIERSYPAATILKNLIVTSYSSITEGTEESVSGQIGMASSSIVRGGNWSSMWSFDKG